MILIHEVQWNNGSGLTLIQSRDIQITQIKDNLWNLPATASRSLYSLAFGLCQPTKFESGLDWLYRF